MAKDILVSTDNNLNNLGKLEINDLTEFMGVGEAKAITIIAALELGRRRQSSTILKKPKILTSKDAFNILAPVLQDLPNEVFYVLLLNRNNKVTKRFKVSSGGVSSTVVDSKIILKEAIKELSTGIILGHNHPSGNLNPSKEDINLTTKIKKAADLLNITVLDHLIIADDTYFSFADNAIVF